MTKALTTGIVDQRSYEGSVEQVSGAAPADDQKHSHEEFNTVKNTIDQHAPLIDAACDLLERITAESGDTESLKNLRDDIESLTQLLASDDTDLDTAQERVDRIKQLIADVESIDIVDVSGLRDELDALALSTQAAADAAAQLALDKENTGVAATLDAALEAALRGTGADTETLRKLRDDIESLTQLLESDDTDLDTAQERVDRIKQLIADVESIDIVDVSGLRAELDALALSAQAAADAAAQLALDKENTGVAATLDAALDAALRGTGADTETLRKLRDDIESLTQLLESDDTDLDTAQERVDRIKQLIADVESIDIVDVSGLRDELDALALSTQAAADAAAQLALDKENAGVAATLDAALEAALRGTGADTETLRKLRDDIESLSQLLASDDTDLDTAQERVDRIKQLIADVESIDIIDVSGLRDELDALALSIVKPDYDAAEADAAGILNKPDLTQSETYNVAKAAATGYVKGVSRILWNGYQYILNTDAVLQAARGNADTVDQTVLPSSGYGSDSSDWVKAGESLVVPFTVKNVAALLADTRAHSVFGNGQIIRTLEEGFSYLVDLQSSLTHDITTAGGVKLLALPGPSGWYNALSFGLIGLGADDTAVIANIASKMGISVVFPEGYVYNIHGSIACNDGQSFLSHGEFVIHENNYSYCFDVTGCKDVTFDGFLVNGQKSIFTYAENTSSDNALNSRTRYSFVFGVSCSNIEVVNCNFSEMYSAAVFLSGNLTAEEPDYTGVLLDRCSYLNGYFELAKIILMGDIVINQCFTSNSTNDFLSNSLLSNGVVTTACSDVRISGNYFGPCDGTGAKMESVNGAISVTGNHFELNDAQGLHLQESSVERGDVSSRREHVTVTGNTFDRPGNYGVYSGSVSASACRNINVVGNTFIACVEGCAYASGDNFTFSNNVSFGLPKTRGGADTNSCGVRIQQENSNEINNVSIVGNTFDMYNQNASGEAIVQMGAAGEVDFSIDTLVIANNIVSDFSFRGFWSNNELYCNNVLISGNVFSKAINDGTSSRDIFAFNSVHDLKWVVIGNIASQSIVVNLNSAGSKTTLLNNKVTASEGPDTANQYYVNGNGPKGSVYDLAGRSVQYLAGPPSSGEWRRGDIVWNDSPSAGDWAGWSCTSGGTPGVWMGFGAIEV